MRALKQREVTGSSSWVATICCIPKKYICLWKAVPTIRALSSRGPPILPSVRSFRWMTYESYSMLICKLRYLEMPRSPLLERGEGRDGHHELQRRGRQQGEAGLLRVDREPHSPRRTCPRRHRQIVGTARSK